MAVRIGAWNRRIHCCCGRVVRPYADAYSRVSTRMRGECACVYVLERYLCVYYPSLLPSFILHPFRMTTDDSGLAWITTRAGSGRKFKQGENVTLSYRGFLLEDFWSPSNGFLKPGLGLAFDSNAEYKTDLSNVRKNETHLCVPLPACVRHGVSSLPCVRANDSTDRFQHEAQLRTVATPLAAAASA